MVMKLEFSQQIFGKYPYIKFCENPASWSRIVSCERTDGHEAYSSFSQFAKVPNKSI